MSSNGKTVGVLAVVAVWATLAAGARAVGAAAQRLGPWRSPVAAAGPFGAPQAREGAGQRLGEPRAQHSAEEIRRDLLDGGEGARGSQRPHEFYFTRGVYTDHGGLWDRGRGTWAIDYPKADRQFLFGLRRLTAIDAYERENPVRLDDPELSRFPFLYVLEVGYMDLTDAEAEGLRRYLLAGGFLFVDDFWGTWQWRNFEQQIRRVLPEYPIVDLPLEHPLFHTLYDIDHIEQVPSLRIIYGGPTWEEDGYVPYVKAIFDEHGRLMVLVNWNTDLGDAWEWVDNPYYPLRYSNYAYQVAVNAILYAMSH